jgi:hypothetical protein
MRHFLYAFAVGALGFYNFPGWLLIAFGWLNPTTGLWIASCIGLAFAAWRVSKKRRGSR